MSADEEDQDECSHVDMLASAVEDVMRQLVDLKAEDRNKVLCAVCTLLGDYQTAIYLASRGLDAVSQGDG